MDEVQKKEECVRKAQAQLEKAIYEKIKIWEEFQEYCVSKAKRIKTKESLSQ